MPAPFRILVADDQPNILLPLEYLLSQIEGAEVYTADEGQRAVDLAIRHKPHLVLLDVMMPNMDGFTACRLIRDGWGEHVGKIWMITARGSNVDVGAAEDAGAEKLITKPFDPDELTFQVAEARAELLAQSGSPL